MFHPKTIMAVLGITTLLLSPVAPITGIFGDDAAFAKALYEKEHVTVLPGSYLARDFNGSNPGQGRIRMALVAETAECLEAAERIARFVRAHPNKV